MNRHLSNRLRKILRNNPEGMTVPALVDLVGATYDGVRKSLFNMPDAYISHWEDHPRSPNPVMVWKVVAVPEHAPRPHDTTTKKAPAPYTPMKTKWVTPPPWAN